MVLFAGFRYLPTAAVSAGVRAYGSGDGEKAWYDGTFAVTLLKYDGKQMGRGVVGIKNLKRQNGVAAA